MSKNIASLQVKKRWWVPAYLLLAKLFYLTMFWFFDEDSEAAFIENVASFVASHGIKCEAVAAKN